MGVEFPVEEVRDLDSDGFLDPSSDSRTTTIASVLSNDHNTDNQREVARIRFAHPEEADLLTNGRIKGILKPTRHIGGALLKEPIARRFIRGDSLTENWHPPYTTASPEVSYRTLTPADRFIVIGTDGLWDLIDNQEAVSLVVEYEALRKEGLIPNELNVCTFVIERALSRAHIPSPSDHLHVTTKGDTYATHLKPETTSSRHELEHLTTILSLPAHMRRDIYDDISVTVIYLDTGKREQAGTAMAALANWACPHFPGSVDRVSKLRKALPLAKPLSRLLASGTSESLVIKEYLEDCWPDRHLDKWTSQSLSTRKFLKSFGIELAPSNAQLKSPKPNTNLEHAPAEPPAAPCFATSSSASGSQPNLSPLEQHHHSHHEKEQREYDSLPTTNGSSIEEGCCKNPFDSVPTHYASDYLHPSAAIMTPRLASYPSSTTTSGSSSPSTPGSTSFLGMYAPRSSVASIMRGNISPTAAPSILDIDFEQSDG